MAEQNQLPFVLLGERSTSQYYGRRASSPSPCSLAPRRSLGSASSARFSWRRRATRSTPPTHTCAASPNTTAMPTSQSSSNSFLALTDDRAAPRDADSSSSSSASAATPTAAPKGSGDAKQQWTEFLLRLLQRSQQESAPCLLSVQSLCAQFTPFACAAKATWDLVEALQRNQAVARQGEPLVYFTGCRGFRVLWLDARLYRLVDPRQQYGKCFVEHAAPKYFRDELGLPESFVKEHVDGTIYGHNKGVKPDLTAHPATGSRLWPAPVATHSREAFFSSVIISCRQDPELSARICQYWSSVAASIPAAESIQPLCCNSTAPLRSLLSRPVQGIGFAPHAGGGALALENASRGRTPSARLGAQNAPPWASTGSPCDRESDVQFPSSSRSSAAALTPSATVAASASSSSSHEDSADDSVVLRRRPTERGLNDRSLHLIRSFIERFQPDVFEQSPSHWVQEVKPLPKIGLCVLVRRLQYCHVKQARHSTDTKVFFVVNTQTGAVRQSCHSSNCRQRLPMGGVSLNNLFPAAPTGPSSSSESASADLASSQGPAAAALDADADADAASASESDESPLSAPSSSPIVSTFIWRVVDHVNAWASSDELMALHGRKFNPSDPDDAAAAKDWQQRIDQKLGEVVAWLNCVWGLITLETRPMYCRVDVRPNDSERGHAHGGMRAPVFELRFQDETAFTHAYLNRCVAMWEWRSDRQAFVLRDRVQLTKLWTAYRGRREYSRVDFDPEKPPDDLILRARQWVQQGLPAALEEIQPGASGLVGDLNLWTGLRISREQARAFVASLPPEQARAHLEAFQQHLLRVWCDDSDPLFAYVSFFFAQRLQRPWEKPGVALVVSGEPGSGKGVVMHTIGKGIIGAAHYQQVMRMGDLLGRFNGSCIRNKVLINVDEALPPAEDKRGAAAFLKTLITEATDRIEDKFLPVLQMRSCASYVFTSNDHHVLPVELNDRRFLCLRARGSHFGRQTAESHAYFQRLWAVPPEVVADWLYSIDLSGFNPRNFPATELHWQQQLCTMRGTPLAWLYERLVEANLPGVPQCLIAESMVRDPWEYSRDSRDLYQHYCDYAAQHGQRGKAVGSTQFWQEIHRFVPGQLKRDRRRAELAATITADLMLYNGPLQDRHSDRHSDNRMQMVRFSPLQDCREAFTRAVGNPHIRFDSDDPPLSDDFPDSMAQAQAQAHAGVEEKANPAEAAPVSQSVAAQSDGVSDSFSDAVAETALEPESVPSDMETESRELGCHPLPGDSDNTHPGAALRGLPAPGPRAGVGRQQRPAPATRSKPARALDDHRAVSHGGEAQRSGVESCRKRKRSRESRVRDSDAPISRPRSALERAVGGLGRRAGSHEASEQSEEKRRQKKMKRKEEEEEEDKEEGEEAMEEEKEAERGADSAEAWDDLCLGESTSAIDGEAED